MKKNCYVWLLMLGDRYLPGLLVSGYSIKRLGTENDLVAMVTPDVSKKGIEELKKIFDKVVKVNYIKKGIKFNSRKQKEKYGKWMHLSYTKWNCLNLLEYEKVFFLDADVIVAQNIDNVFKFNKISGTFFNPWAQIKDSRVKDYYKNKRIITNDMIIKGLYRYGFVAYATSLLLFPDKDLFKAYKKMITKENFNFKTFSGADETTLAYFMSIYKNGPKLEWRNLSQCYQYMYKNGKCCENNRICKKIKIIHMFGDILPWESKRELYDENDLWFSICNEMLKKVDIDIEKINIVYKEEIKKALVAGDEPVVTALSVSRLHHNITSQPQAK